MSYRSRSHHAIGAGIAGCVFAIASGASAGVTVYSGAAGWQSWQQAAGGFTTLDFTDLGQWEPVAPDRYASSGALFTDLDGNVGETNSIAFPQDSHGLLGFCVIEVSFTSPMQSVGMHFPGSIRAWLYSGDTLVAHINSAGGGGVNFFLGFASETSFDRLVLRRFSFPPPEACNWVEIDNLYFSAVPSPGAIAVIALGGWRPGKRRRSD